MLIDLPTAKAHLRVDTSTDDAQITLYLSAACDMAARFLNRNIYEDQNAMDAAIASVPASILAAGVIYTNATTANAAIEDEVARLAENDYALMAYGDVQSQGYAARYGIVINDTIRAGILLILGHLYENREDVVAGVTVASLPMGSRAVLMPYRVAMGV